MGSRICAVAVALAVGAFTIFLLPAEAQFGGYGGPFIPPMFPFPPMPPFPNNFTNITCDDVHCGKGNCTIHSNYTKSSNGSSYSYSYSYSYSCNCEPGWHQASSSRGSLPCVIPKCTLNYNCSHPATGPPSPPVIDYNNPNALLDPCSWAVCGAGKCIKTSDYTHRCDCDPGFKNLLNIAMFPCYTECTLGNDCKKMGVGFEILNQSSTQLLSKQQPISNGSQQVSSRLSSSAPSIPPASAPSGSSNRATAALHGDIPMMLFLVAYLML